MLPPVLPLTDDEDLDPSPCSPGLRSSIRLAVFESLAANAWCSPAHQQALSTRLFDWCGIPQYDDARNALLRYVEVLRKLEEVLADVFAESDEAGDLIVSLEGDVSIDSLADETSTPDQTIVSRVSSHCSSSSSSGLPTGRSCETSLCVHTHPLFHGMPGRELSASKTDGAAFACDLNASPVRCYPNDVSREQWSQHPLARSLALSPKEKAFLGLILPAEIADREF